jgi:hypothetical protein
VALVASSTAPLVIAGSLAPAVGAVTVTLSAVSGTTLTRLRRRKVKVAGDGLFQVDFGTRPPGAYEITATTAATAENAAGAAPPLQVTIPPAVTPPAPGG